MRKVKKARRATAFRFGNCHAGHALTKAKSGRVYCAECPRIRRAAKRCDAVQHPCAGELCDLRAIGPRIPRKKARK